MSLIKPLIYLDHNVWDHCVKHVNSQTLIELKQDGQFVFSLENIKEIKKSKGFENKFIEILKVLEAKYLNIILDSDNYFSDNAQVRDVNFWDQFLEEDIFDMVANQNILAMQRVSLKLAGGLQGSSFQEIINNQKEAYEKIFKVLDEISGETKRELMDKGNTTFTDFEKTLNSVISDDKNWRGIQEVRNKLSISPKQLNNIKPPNVILQIWKLISEVEEIKKHNMSLEGIFVNFAYPHKPLAIFDKIGRMYDFLNWVGYFPDSDITKENRFLAANSDRNHVCYAAFSNILLTSDERLFRKASAIYEYLNIGTKIKYLQD